MKPTKQEQKLLECYRAIRSKWERLVVLLIVQSFGWGRLTAKSDSYSLRRMRRMLETGK